MKEQPTNPETKAAADEVREETAIAVKDEKAKSEKIEKAPFSNYWVGILLVMVEAALTSYSGFSPTARLLMAPHSRLASCPRPRQGRYGSICAV
jgi:hypothetical protein